MIYRITKLTINILNLKALFKRYFILKNLYKMRYLTHKEKLLARTVFGDLIDYAKPKIIAKPFLPWQPIGIFIAPNGNIYMNPSD